MKSTLAILATLLAMVAALALTTGLALGQVQPTQGGHELDANNRVGSQGFNSIRSLDPSGTISGNLFINGQVTRGASFQGPVPYFAANQLNLTLPSQQFDNFVRDSTSLNRVQAGQSLAPQPYLGPSNTVLGAGAIAAGYNAPGTNVPQNPTGVSDAIASRLFVDATADYRPVVAGPTFSDIRLEALSPRLNFSPTAVTSIGEAGAVASRASMVFGVLSATELRRLAEQVTETPTAIAEATAKAAETPNTTLTPAPNEVSGKVAAQVTGEPQNLVPETHTPQSVTGQPTLAPLPAQPAQPGEQVVPGQPVAGPEAAARRARPTLPAPVDQDVYTDVLQNLARQRAERTAMANAPIAPPTGGQTTANPLDLNRQQSEYSRAVVEATNRQIVLHGLAGQRPDQLNRYMALGDALMKQGQYYEAAGRYEIARSLNKTNPVPSVGLGLAYLAAGEPMTSSYYLSRAMELFPPLMEIKLDLNRIVGEKVTALRIEQIEQRLKENREANIVPLVFLATYLNANQGQAEQAKVWAAKLKEVAGDRRVLAAYADYVLTGVKPAQQPARAR